MKDLLKCEFIGLNIEITDSKNKSDVGIKGKIIDETKQTFTIQTKESKKIIFKKNITFKTNIDKKDIQIEGKYLIGRPKDRIKNN